MSTESDLRASISELADEGDTRAVVDRLLAAASSTAVLRRRRRALPVAVAALVAAIVIGVALAVSGTTDRRHSSDTAVPTATSPCATSTTPSFSTFTVGPVADLDTSITAATSCAGYRVRSYYTTSGGILGEIALYQPGVFRQAALRGGHRVTGSGITGYYVSQLPSPTSGASCTAKVAVSRCSPGVAWQYTTRAWATITFDGPQSLGGVAKIFFGTDPVAKLLAVAAAVRPEADHALLSPFRLANLAGTLPLTAGTSTTSLHHNDVGEAAAQIELAVPGDGPSCPHGAACTATVSINVNSTVDPPGSSLGAFKGRHVRVGRGIGLLITGKQVPASGIASELRFRSAHWVAIIDVFDTHADLTDEQLFTLARGMTFAPSTTDSGTWYPFDRALPH